MNKRNDVLGQAEELADSQAVIDFAAATWRDPEVAARFEERPAETLAEFGIELPPGVDVVPLGTGQIGMPGPDFEPFQIRFSRCRTVVVRNPRNGKLSTETVCFGIEIVPTRVPGGPKG
jgi:hypothetical protein